MLRFRNPERCKKEIPRIGIGVFVVGSGVYIYIENEELINTKFPGGLE